MECLICHKSFKAITNSHLKKHGVSPKEYETMFGVKTVPIGWSAGSKNAFYGCTHDEHSRVKSEEYGLAVSKRTRGKTYEELYGIETATRVKKLRSERILGSNNPAWCGGIDNRGYPREFIRKRGLIRSRDGCRCIVCNEPAKHVHHIDYDKLNNDDLNLITMCNSCHIKTNFNRDYWQETLSDLIINKYGNPQLSLLNGYKGKQESSETRLVRSPTNNPTHERPTSL